MSGRFCVLLIFAVLTNFVNPQDGEWELPETREKNEGNLKLQFIRATSTSVYVEATCDPSCEGITWKTMTYRFTWNYDRPVVKNLGNDHYVLTNLSSRYHYTIQANKEGSFDKIAARTCPEYLGPLHDLHSRYNGPGWLDIRWEPYYSFDCRQDIQYITRHKVEGGNFSDYRTYGAYPIDNKGNLHIGPSHPCDDWPRHFCLLITENVEAGKNHTVEIQPMRIGGGEHDMGHMQTIVVYADPHNMQGAPNSGVHPQCQMWAWLALGSCLFCIAVIIGVLVSALITTYEKNQRLQEEALEAENDANRGNDENEETEETALTAGTVESTQSEEMLENAESKGSKEKIKIQ